MNPLWLVILGGKSAFLDKKYYPRSHYHSSVACTDVKETRILRVSYLTRLESDERDFVDAFGVPVVEIVVQGTQQRCH